MTPLGTVESVAILRARTGLGDLLCGVPGLRALRARLPHAHITLITYAEMAPVVERMRTYVDELLPFPGWPGIPERPVDEQALPAYLADARARRFDLALQAYGANPAANEATAALGARRTGGFFITGTIEPDLAVHLPYPEHRHEIDRHLDLMAHLGAPPAGRALEFPLTPEDEASAAAVKPDGPYALVHPGATSPSRRWPAERFARVADELARRGLQVGITGVPSEAELVAEVRGHMRAPSLDLCGRTSLGGFAALLRDAELIVSNDTGAAHLAAAVDTPSVTLFLAGDPVRWAHPRPHAVVRVQVECNPCRHLVCPIDHRCAQRLEVAHVLAAVDAL
ncbi:glycosyltransferase family 9 protein [Solirubrobacter sp. CPCC 204708]|uniref:Glycosyltransferase family 9 protein n=1 Tax=Solirubrobacter deserti TaxID=2282478 RepID=A0ABT4RJC7_9ACTN|nr:glycosyltransferase family 9 protein [Solirubrobacter deserti]MBE2317667.1 glycosyltransferase family 9 protein [Solirubrobacter deserti]MDA0138617.1 glycosyltransferase family 9 protein [Solirubrobacter deserti]